MMLQATVSGTAKPHTRTQISIKLHFIAIDKATEKTSFRKKHKYGL